MTVQRRIQIAIAVAVAATSLVPAAAGAVKFKRLATVNGGPAQAVAVVRRSDGALQLVFQTFAGRTLSGLAAMSISKSGTPGPQVQALSGWTAGQPGLVQLPGGTLEAVFGAISSGNVSSVWGITSSNGGSSWTAPTDVRGGGSTEALAYASDITAAMSGTTPVLSLPQAGNIIVQRGLGLGSPSFQLTNTSDGSATDADLAVDAATGEVVAGWQSIAGPNPTDYLQGAVPTVGAAQAVPGQGRNALIPAGRDKGSGVFAAYTSDGTHVRLLRYGGGSVAVGSLKGVTAKALGTATSVDGRIWVMWGDESGGLGVTRSNKAVTRFEPIQRLNPNAFTLARLAGDGRLGPLDLLVDEIPNAKGSVPPVGLFYARVLPELSADISSTKVKNKVGKVIAFKLTVTVTDAGDSVAGASVAAAGTKKTTNAKGKATLSLPASTSSPVAVTVTAAGYQPLKLKASL
jgi:hypothetical protein